MALAALALLVCSLSVAAAPATRRAAVDDAGVLRWRDDGSEVALFGVNYYTPCSINLPSAGSSPTRARWD